MIGTLAVSLGAGDRPRTRACIVTTADGETISGHVVEMSLDQGLTLLRADGQQQHVEAASVVRIVGQAPTRPDDPQEVSVTTAWGDVLRGRFRESEAEAVLLETADAGRILVSLSAMTRVAHPQSRSPSHAASVAWLDRERGTAEDRVLLTNGDVLRGFVTRIDPQGIQVDTALGTTQVPHRTVVEARLISTRGAELSGLRVLVTMQGSGRITATDLHWNHDELSLTLPGGQEAVVAAERVVELEVVGGRWEWLSGHGPVSFEHVPMLRLPFEFHVDRNVLGGPLVVAGETHPRGIGVHSRSSLIYELRGAYRELVTSYGIDDDSGPLADVTAVVLVDGQRRHVQTHVRRGQLFGPVRIDVKDARRIELRVEFGDHGDVQDRFDWIATALVR